MAAGEQDVQQYPEGINVRRGCDRLAADLLGAGLIGCKRMCGSLLSRRSAGSQQLRDSEIHQPWDTLICHQNIAGLDIPMNHQILMRVADRGADALKKL